ncbi:MAG: bis(5'-nucleosyl)-tetraphosphatase [Minisyncoccia bacterium]
MTNEVSAGIIIYRMVDNKPKFLLLYQYGRYWNFPKGKIKPGEGNFKTALREVYEETGLANRDLMFKTFFKAYDKYTFIRNQEEINKIVTFYLAETKRKNIKLSDEHDGYGWFDYEVAHKMLMHNNLKQNLKAAYETIIKKRYLPFSKKNTQG